MFRKAIRPEFDLYLFRCLEGNGRGSSGEESPELPLDVDQEASMNHLVQLIHCINCHAIYLKTPFDQLPEYEFFLSHSSDTVLFKSFFIPRSVRRNTDFLPDYSETLCIRCE